VIIVSPTEKVEKLVNDRRKIKIITPEEFKKLFVGDWKRVWDNDRISYTANKLAAFLKYGAFERRLDHPADPGGNKAQVRPDDGMVSAF
jgi:hypothetical protein